MHVNNSPEAGTSTAQRIALPATTVINRAETQPAIHPQGFLPHVRPNEAREIKDFFDRLGHKGRVLSAIKDLRRDSALSIQSAGAGPASAADRPSDKGWIRRNVWELSDWPSAGKGMSGDKPYQRRVSPEVSLLDDELDRLKGSIGRMDIPEASKAYFKAKLNEETNHGDRIMTDTRRAERYATWGAVALGGLVFSLLYPHLANERLAMSVVDSSVFKSEFTGIIRAFVGTATGRQAFEYFMQRYVGFSTLSAALAGRLMPLAATQFMKHPAWASFAGVFSASLQTWIFAGDGIKKAYQRSHGNPAIDGQTLGPEQQAMFRQITDYLDGAVAHAVHTLRDSEAAKGDVISFPMNAHRGKYLAGLAGLAEDASKLSGAPKVVNVDQDRAEKRSVAYASMALLWALPLVLLAQTMKSVIDAKASGDDPAAAAQRHLFLLLDSFCVAAAISTQSWFTAADPAVNASGKYDWFRTMMTFSLPKVGLVGANWALGDIVNRQPMVSYYAAIALAGFAMTFGGGVGKGMATGLGYMLGSNKRRVADVEQPALLPQASRAELEGLVRDNIALVRDADAAFAEAFEANDKGKGTTSAQTPQGATQPVV